MYFESHAHYDDPRFDADRKELLPALNADGVDYIVNIGACVESSERSVALAREYAFVYAAVGTHPHDASGMTEAGLNRLRELCACEKVVAVGEIGLDYHYDNSPRELQRHWFEKQLALAEAMGLPVVIHSREATEDTLAILRASGVRRGVLHCFSGSMETALEYARMGFHIGVGGVVTFPNAKNLARAVAALPAERILLETDCPYLSPAPKRGERNDSRNLKYICEKIAQIRQTSHEEIAELTSRNAMSFFGII